MTEESATAMEPVKKKAKTNLNKREAFERSKKLLLAVEKRSCLYDDKHPEYGKDDVTELAWKQVVCECQSENLPGDFSVIEAQALWASSKKNFSKERSRRRKGNTNTGTGWLLYDYMVFMDKHMPTRNRLSKKESSKLISGKDIKKELLTQDDSSPSRAVSPMIQENGDETETNDGDNESVKENNVIDNGIEVEKSHEQKQREHASRLKELKRAQEREKFERLQLEKQKAQEEMRRAEREKQELEEQRELEEQNRRRLKESDAEINRSVANVIVATLNRINDEKERRAAMTKIWDVLYKDDL